VAILGVKSQPETAEVGDTVAVILVCRRVEKRAPGKDEFPGRWQLSTATSTDQQKRENSVLNTVGKAQLAERGALFWPRQRPPVTGAPVAELIRRAIDVYL